METLFASHESCDQQMDVATGGNYEEDDRKWSDDDGAPSSCFLMIYRLNKLIHVRFLFNGSITFAKLWGFWYIFWAHL